MNRKQTHWCAILATSGTGVGTPAADDFMALNVVLVSPLCPAGFAELALPGLPVAALVDFLDTPLFDLAVVTLLDVPADLALSALLVLVVRVQLLWPEVLPADRDPRELAFTESRLPRVSGFFSGAVLKGALTCAGTW